MANGREIGYLRGKLFWFKALPGQLHDNYNKDGKQWAFDLSLDADGVKHAKQHKELNIKDKDDDRGKFLTFKQKELRYNGDANKPIKIVDAAGNPWPETKQIGNGSVADVKFEIRDFGKGKYPGVYPRAVRVLDLVEYESQEFAPIDEDDEYAGAAKAAVEDWSGFSAEEDKHFKDTFMGSSEERDPGDGTESALDDDLDDVL